MGFRQSYAFRHPRQGVLVNGLLLLAMGLLLYGLVTPILSLEKFYLFSNTVSLWSAIETLWQTSEWGLLILVGGFSVLFPMLKILLLLLIWNLEDASGQRHQRHLRWLETYSKWSMLDVFVVALLVVSVKLGALVQAQVEPGIYAFAASVVLSMLVADWTGRRTRR